MDLYAILGVARSASPQEIRKAYIKRAKATHPDSGGAEEDFKNISLAYEVLKDADRRAFYDEHGHWDQKAIAREAEQIKAMIAGMLLNWVVNGGEAIAQHDLVKLIRTEFEKGIAANTEQLGKLTAAKKSLSVIAKRFKRKANDSALNGIALLIADQIKAMDAQHASLTANIELIKKALAFIDEYKFEALKMERSFLFTSAGTGSSTFSGYTR